MISRTGWALMALIAGGLAAAWATARCHHSSPAGVIISVAIALVPLAALPVVWARPLSAGARPDARKILSLWFVFCWAAIEFVATVRSCLGPARWLRGADAIMLVATSAGIYWIAVRQYGCRLARLTPRRVAAAGLLGFAQFLLLYRVRSPLGAQETLAFLTLPVVGVALLLVLLEPPPGWAGWWG